LTVGIVLILEAFSAVLHQAAQRWMTAKEHARPTVAFNARFLLFSWLSQQLQTPLPPVPHKQAYPSLQQYNRNCTERQVIAVLQTELALATGKASRQTTATPLRLQAFHARSATGKRLLDTLCEFCDSYEQWLFNRWLHHLKASDFDSTLQD
jgi:hypothetical protein